MKLRPTGNNMIVQIPEKEAITKSGIVIPDSAEQEKPQQGKVIAVGGKVKNINEGDTVLFARYSAIDIEFEKEEYLIITELDVLAKMNEGNDK